MKKILFVSMLVFVLALSSCSISFQSSQNPQNEDEADTANTPAEVEQNQTVTISVFFPSEKNNADFVSCSKTDPATREVAKSDNLAYLAMMELFKGPTEAEKATGLKDFHWITPATSANLKSVKVINGTAYVNWLDMRMAISNAGTSCGSASFLSPVNDTLKNLPGINNVVHAINGKPATFYEWMQLSCPQESNNCDATPFN